MTLKSAGAFVGAFTAFLIGCDVKERRTTSTPEKVFGVPTLSENSAIVIDGLRSCIESMAWVKEQDYLQVVFSHEFTCKEDGGEGRNRWTFNQHSLILYFLYWDARGDKLSYESRVDTLHDVDFIIGKTKRDVHVLRVTVPIDAAYIAVQRGVELNWTRRVPLPKRD